MNQQCKESKLRYYICRVVELIKLNSVMLTNLTVFKYFILDNKDMSCCFDRGEQSSSVCTAGKSTWILI